MPKQKLMQEQTDGMDDQIEHFLSTLMQAPDRDWLETDDAYRIRVHLSQADYAVLTLVGGDLLERLVELGSALGKGDDGQEEQDEHDTGAQSTMASLLSGDNAQVWAMLDELETRSIAEWNLNQWADAYDAEVPATKPGGIKDADERVEFLKRLPLRTHYRLIYGLVWGTKKG